MKSINSKEKTPNINETNYNEWLDALPFKIGDTAYFAVEDNHNAAVIDQIVIDRNGLCFEWTIYESDSELTNAWYGGRFTLSDIGKTVFHTCEEASYEINKKLYSEEEICAYEKNTQCSTEL